MTSSFTLAAAGLLAASVAEASVISPRYAEIDGLQMAYREAGPVNAPVVVLLHGSPASSHMFRELIPLLSGRFRVIAPDYIGFGNSDMPSASEFDYSFDRLALGVEKLLEHLAVDTYILYMQDYGGPVGFRLATRHPERVTGLIIQNANAYHEGLGRPVLEAFEPFWKKRTKENEAILRGFISPEGIRQQYITGALEVRKLSPSAWTVEQALFQRPGRAEVELELFADYRRNLELYPAWQAYFRKHQPKTLIVWGKNDPLFIPAGASAFKRDLPGAKLVWLAGGHFALQEHADSIASHIIAFFNATQLNGVPSK